MLRRLRQRKGPSSSVKTVTTKRSGRTLGESTAAKATTATSGLLKGVRSQTASNNAVELTCKSSSSYKASTSSGPSSLPAAAECRRSSSKRRVTRLVVVVVVMFAAYWLPMQVGGIDLYRKTRDESEWRWFDEWSWHHSLWILMSRKDDSAAISCAHLKHIEEHYNCVKITRSYTKKMKYKINFEFWV